MDNKERYRVVTITENKDILSKNCPTKEEVDDFLLNIEGLKRFRVLDKETKKIIETEEGVRK